MNNGLGSITTIPGHHWILTVNNTHSTAIATNTDYQYQSSIMGNINTNQ